MRTKLFLSLLTAVLLARAQEVSPWKLSLESNLTLTLNTYSTNWTGAEKGSFTWVGKMTGIAEKQIIKQINNLNTLKLAFGQTKTENKDAVTGDRTWTSPAKSTDLIDFETVFKFTLGGWVDPYLSGKAVSQFFDPAPDFDYYFNPVDFTESFGVMRDLIKKDNMSSFVRFGGAFKQNVNRRRPADTLTLSDGGLELVAEYKADKIKETISFLSRLSIYEALFRFNAPEGYTDFRHPDVKWENVLTVSLFKYLMLSYSADLLYDIETETSPQFRQSFGAGVTFLINNSKAAQ